MSNEQVVLQQYLEFCASPLRTEQSIKDEYQQLLRNPDVTHVAFHKPHILMVGTKTIVITSNDIEYEVGEFILFLIRKRVGRVWETRLRFANMLHPPHEFNGKHVLETIIMHPHIMGVEDSDIDFPTGELCIASGQLPIYQSLRKGYINTAVAHLMVVLRTYGTGAPLRTIEHWPQIIKDSDDA